MSKRAFQTDQAAAGSTGIFLEQQDMPLGIDGPPRPMLRTPGTSVQWQESGAGLQGEIVESMLVFSPDLGS